MHQDMLCIFVRCAGEPVVRRRYRVRTREEFEAATGQAAPVGKNYFQHTALADIIGAYPIRCGTSDEAVAREKQQRQAFVDFLLGVLDLDPASRWTPRQAMQHPFITGGCWCGEALVSWQEWAVWGAKSSQQGCWVWARRQVCGPSLSLGVRVCSRGIWCGPVEGQGSRAGAHGELYGGADEPCCPVLVLPDGCLCQGAPATHTCMGFVA